MKKLKKAYAVVGCNYGDEGRGRIVDFLVRKTGAGAVVRPNGAGQATHTVCVGDKTHAFGSLSAGTFAGATTLISADSFVNPTFFVPEYIEMKSEVPTVYIDEHARIILPEDMLFNQLTELSRGNNRHGSCGHGLNAAVKRSATHPITYSDFFCDRRFNDLREKAREEYYRNAMTPELLTAAEENGMQWIFDDAGIRDTYRSYVDFMRKRFGPIEVNPGLLGCYDPVVFELSQGLALDRNSPEFPHVTNSNTGLTNVLGLLDSDTELSAVYCTRTYTTRHGAGPLQDSSADIDNLYLADRTNLPNNWQGAIRYAPLDWDALLLRVEKDIRQVADTQRLTKVLSLGHCDAVAHRDARFPILCDGEITYVTLQKLAAKAYEHFDSIIFGYGPAAENTFWRRKP